MSLEPTAVPPLIGRFAIAYQAFTGANHNADFKGEGELIVREGPVFIFTGRPRPGSPAEPFGQMVFTRDQIWNVQVDERCVRFETKQGQSGRQLQPFMFFCASSTDAATVGSLLPRTLDADATAGIEFGHQLRKLPGAKSPWTSATHLIIAANVVVFVLMGLAGAGWFDVASMEPYMRFGANRADVTTDGQWWRLVSAMFIHYGLMHLLLNMWALYQTGHLVERLFGRGLFVLLYFGAGISGSFAAIAWHRDHLVWSAGASGAVFGVYGALAGYMRRERQALPKRVYQPLLKSTLVFAGYNLLYGLVNPAIDNAAHIGGLIGGAVLGWLMALPVNADARAALVARRLRAGLAGLAGIVVVGAAIAPRYDYSYEDERAFAQANAPHGGKEEELLIAQKNQLRAYAREGDRDGTLRWIATEALPFYSGWLKDVRALHLTPGRPTETRRRGFENILQMKVESFTRLQDAIRQGDAQALAEFDRTEATIAAEVKQLAGKTK